MKIRWYKINDTSTIDTKFSCSQLNIQSLETAAIG